MTTATATLAEFLLARYAEDEAAAERGRRHNDTGTFANDNYGCLLVDPARVLADCEAKRRIVELHSGDHECSTFDRFGEIDNCTWVLGGDCSTMRYLALPFADHPDYRPEWKP